MPLRVEFAVISALVAMCLLMSEPEQAHGEDNPAAATPRTYEKKTVEGWTVQVETSLLKDCPAETELALKLLQQQLQEVVKVVPAPAVEKLRVVTLWFSPLYPGVRASAEYHPGRQWLVDQKRNPEMVKGVEFTNIKTFEKELDRMPNFALHELAHAYHDQVFGFDNDDIASAYAHAKDSQSYDNVERWSGTGIPIRREKAYAMTNPMEYFAETSEAFFTRNDFYPFNHEELLKHDPEMEKLLTKVWGVVRTAPATSP